MTYQEQLKNIEDKINSTDNKGTLKKFLDSVKVSDLKVNDKARLIDEIELKLTGRRFTNNQVLKDIEDGLADISDIKGW